MGMVVKNLLIISMVWLIQAANSPKTILFYGDSLTAGYGLSPEEAFPAIVGQKLSAKGKQIKIINAGLSGETSAGGLTRIDWVLRQPVDIFILELGPNDGLRGLPLEQTEKNLQAIIDKVRAKNPDVKIVIAGMLVPPNMGPDYSSKFRALFPRLAKKNSAALIPFLLQDVAGIEKLNQPDGIHPNVEGHRIVAENVLRVIDPLI
jgi:acyl-CoA thioesterase-1